MADMTSKAEVYLLTFQRHFLMPTCMYKTMHRVAGVGFQGLKPLPFGMYVLYVPIAYVVYILIVALY